MVFGQLVLSSTPTCSSAMTVSHNPAQLCLGIANELNFFIFSAQVDMKTQSIRSKTVHGPVIAEVRESAHFKICFAVAEARAKQSLHFSNSGLKNKIKQNILNCSIPVIAEIRSLPFLLKITRSDPTLFSVHYSSRPPRSHTLARYPAEHIFSLILCLGFCKPDRDFFTGHLR